MSDVQPLYARVKTHIVENIRSGKWQPGTRVPSENELVEHFSISRMTANRALRELFDEGFVKRVPGVGTFVRDNAPRASLLELRDIAEEITARGHRYSSRLITRETISANPALAEEFEAAEKLPVFHVVIVHEENGIPVQLEDRNVNAEAAPEFFDQDFSQTTPAGYLISSVPVGEIEHTVEAAMPNAHQATLLHMSLSEPCLVLHRRTFNGDSVVTVSTLTYPASRYALYSRQTTGAGLGRKS